LDGSGYLEFEEFCQLSAKFLVEEDEESMKKELKEAFRIYDKEGQSKLFRNCKNANFSFIPVGIELNSSLTEYVTDTAKSFFSHF
jgi:hypothetical protein